MVLYATNTAIDDEEGSCEFSGSGSGGGESGDVGSVNSYSPMTERESVMPNFREDAGNEASHQPLPSDGSSQGMRPGPIVIVAYACIF